MKIRINLFYSGCVATDVEVENEDEVYEKKDDFFETVTDEDIADAVSYDDWTYDILDEKEAPDDGVGC